MSRVLCFLIGWHLLSSAFAGEIDVLSVAQAVSREEFPGFIYGNTEKLCQVNCVQFTGAVLERILGRRMSRDERDAVFIHYPITEFEQALKNGDSRMSGVARAIADVLRVGKIVPPQEVSPGDFIQYWIKRPDGRWFGHSAIVARRFDRDDGVVAVSIYGSHKATNGVAELDFRGVGLPLQGDDRYVFVARLGKPPAIANSPEGQVLTKTTAQE